MTDSSHRLLGSGTYAIPASSRLTGVAPQRSGQPAQLSGGGRVAYGVQRASRKLCAWLLAGGLLALLAVMDAGPAAADVATNEPTDSRLARSLFKQAFVYASRGECEEAVRLFRIGFKLDATDDRAHDYLARCLLEMGLEYEPMDHFIQAFKNMGGHTAAEVAASLPRPEAEGWVAASVRYLTGMPASTPAWSWTRGLCVGAGGSVDTAPTLRAKRAHPCVALPPPLAPVGLPLLGQREGLPLQEQEVLQGPVVLVLHHLLCLQNDGPDLGVDDPALDDRPVDSARSRSTTR